jgi:thymidylate synthase (FAD)
MISVLQHGFVRLDAVCADDLAVVNAARVSFGKRKTDLDDADRGLIRFLLRERHTSPFEHSYFRFHVACPIFVAREWFRHRTWSYNEISARYTELPEVYHVPDEVRTQVGKPGAYVFEPVDDELSDRVQGIVADTSRRAFEAYHLMLDAGIAKEVARSVLPVGTFTEFYASVDALNLMKFLSLRNHPAAQREIRLYAEALESIFAEQMPVTYAAYKEFN